MPVNQNVYKKGCTRLVVIGAQHLCRHRLSEPSAAGDAAITLFGVKRSIDNWYETRLVNIIVSDYVAEFPVASIDVYTHSFKPVAGVICP